MSTFKPGTRVGVIGRSTDSGIDFLGYGVYEGEIEAPKDSKLEGHFGRVKLDSGGEVWEFEYEGCGAEERLREFLRGQVVREIPLEEFRKSPPAAKDGDSPSLRVASEEGVRTGIELATAILRTAEELARQTGDYESAGSFMMNAANTIATMTLFNICAVYLPEGQRSRLYQMMLGDVSRAMVVVMQKYANAAPKASDPVAPEPSKIVLPS